MFKPQIIQNQSCIVDVLWMVFSYLAISGKFMLSFSALLQVVLDHVARAESLHREDHPS